MKLKILGILSTLAYVISIALFEVFSHTIFEESKPMTNGNVLPILTVTVSANSSQTSFLGKSKECNTNALAESLTLNLKQRLEPVKAAVSKGPATPVGECA